MITLSAAGARIRKDRGASLGDLGRGEGGVAIARCAFIKADGERCQGVATGGAEWCYSHDPSRAEERRRNASRGGRAGGRGRADNELTTIKALCEDLTERVLAGELPTGPAAVANQLINTRLRAIEVERKVKEQEEILPRLDALERARKQASKGGRTPWGA